MMATGSKADPWVLKTAPGSSEYTMYRDEEAEPAVLVCHVGSTKLTYDLRAIDDLHQWLSEQGDWVPLGAADEKKDAADGHGGGLGPLSGEPDWWLVRPAQGLPGAIRHVSPAPARGARPRRAHPRGAQQQHARHLNRPTQRTRENCTMTTTKVVRYRTKPEQADENERLIREVFAELAQEASGRAAVRGVPPRRRRELRACRRHSTEKNPLTSSPAFAAFQAGIAERCAEGPLPADATAIGNFRLLS